MAYHILCYAIVVFLILIPGKVCAQTQQDSIDPGLITSWQELLKVTAEPVDTLAPKPRFSGAPLIFVQPETGFAFGAGGIWYHRPRKVVLPGKSVSSMIGLVLYSVRGQFISEVRGQLFTDADSWRLQYQLGYSYYPFQFFGVGNDTREEDEESYTNQFPIVDLTGLREVAPHFFVGVNAFLEHNRFSNLQDSGLLASGEFLGVDGGLNWGIGPRLLYDSRDNIFYPYSGYYASAGVVFHREELGSTWSYTNWELDLRAFHDLGRHHILAWQVYGQVVSGAPPFHRLALFGGPDRMRGFLQGQYRDQYYATAQLEYRFPIWKIIRGAAFGGVGDVEPELRDFAFRELLFSGGAGLRLTLSEKERTQIRFDFGVGSGGTTGFYLQFRESF